jgi:hypothetical protein
VEVAEAVLHLGVHLLVERPNLIQVIRLVVVLHLAFLVRLGLPVLLALRPLL